MRQIMLWIVHGLLLASMALALAQETIRVATAKDLAPYAIEAENRGLQEIPDHGELQRIYQRYQETP